MYTPSTLTPSRPRVVRRSQEDAHLMGQLCTEAAREVAAAFDGVHGKRIDRAGLPGFGRHGISRAINGSATNPLFRLAGIFVLARRLGVPKHRLQRCLDWLQEKLDQAYADAEPAPLREVLEKESDLDAADDPHQMRAAYGCVVSLRAFLEAKRQELAYTPEVIRTVRLHLARMEAR